MQNISKVYSMKNDVVSEINLTELHRFILTKISVEFSEMTGNCYYPKISEIYRDLLHMTNSNEKELKQYSKDKYASELKYRAKFQLLHDPFTTLLIIIVQQFLKAKDIAAAQAAFHLFSLRYYTNIFHIMTTPKNSRKSFCDPEAFQSALDNLSKNHMFVKQRTIPSSIMYYSNAIFKIHYKDLINDDSEGLFRMIYELRTRIMQSMRSFADKYYKAHEEKNITKEKEDVGKTSDQTHETKLRNFITKIAYDMCVYGKVDTEAAVESSNLIKFNKKLSVKYVEKISSPQFKDDIETALYMILKDIKDISYIKSNSFLDHVQKLMSIKITKQEIYFKKVITGIHNQIITILGLEHWYNNLSIQSKSISRNFVAYYLVFYLRKYI